MGQNSLNKEKWIQKPDSKHFPPFQQTRNLLRQSWKRLRDRVKGQDPIQVPMSEMTPHLPTSQRRYSETFVSHVAVTPTPQNHPM